MSPRFLVLFMGLLISAQPVATDINLASFPAIAQDFGTSILQIQLTFSAMLLAFGVSQLLLGSMSDKFGRKPVLLWGMAAFTLCALGAALAPSPEILIAIRVLQGLALGAAVMCARAMVRDVYDPQSGAMAMSKAFSLLGTIAMACAIVGAVIAQYLHWRLSYLVIALYGLGVWYVTYTRFEETLQSPNPKALNPLVIARFWREFFVHPTFWTYCAVTTLSYLALFSFLSCSSFVLIQTYGLGKLQYGLALFAMPIFYILGTVYCRRLLRRMSLARAITTSAWIMAVAGALILGLEYSATVYPALKHPLAILVPFYIFMMGHGVMQSSGQTAVVANFAHAAGAAAAMNGFLMMLCTFVLSLWLGTHLRGMSFALAHGFGLACLALTLVAWLVVPRFGKLSDA